jgi:hypothetical protein
MTNPKQHTITVALPNDYAWGNITHLPDKAKDDLKAKKNSEQIDENVIIIDDIKDIDDIISDVRPKDDPNAILKVFTTIGVAPSPAMSENLVQKFFISVFLSAILSVWVPNALLLSTFVVLNLIEFFSGLFLNRKMSYRTHLSNMIGNFLLVAMATFIELLIGRPQILFTPLTISVLAVALFFSNMSLIWTITKRIAPLTSLARSGRFGVLLKGIKVGYEACSDYIQKEFPKGALDPEKKKKKK